jgi:DNA-binding response OmpR family regulator
MPDRSPSRRTAGVDIAPCGAPLAVTEDTALPALVAALAHALEAPLAAVNQALTDLETAPRLGDAAAQRLARTRVTDATEDIRAALAALGAYCELRRGVGALRSAPVDLGDLLMNIIPAWKPRAPRHTFELALPGELPTIVADEQRVEQALSLLLEHAVKMMPRGGTIRVSVRPRHDEIVVSVRQQMRAVAESQLDQIFAPFARLEGCEEVVVGGGLGLALARAIVEAHGGRAWAERLERPPGLLTCAAWPLVPPPVAGRALAPAAEAATPEAATPEAATPARDHLPLARSRQVVLVAVADAHLGRYLRANLEAERFRAVAAADAGEVRRLIDLEEPDLVLLEADLSGMDGVDGVRLLRSRAHVPIVVLARRHDPLECAAALNQGASDYLARPFSVEELVARVRVALRAAVTTASPAAAEEPIFASGDLCIDFGQRSVSVAGSPVSLSKTEFKLLRALAHSAGKVLSHEALLERVWGPGYAHEVEFIWVYIRRLRRKIEPDPARPRYIQTVPGVGYRLVRG